MCSIKQYQKEEVQNAVLRFFSLKPQFLNYYGQPLEDIVDYVETESSLVLRKKEGHFFRVYIMSVFQADVVDILKGLPDINVLNIPAKNNIPEWNVLMELAGYKNISVYERYYYKKVRVRKDLRNVNYASNEQADEIYSLFGNHFSLYTDYLPNKNELLKLIAKRSVVVNYKDEKLCGAFVYELKGQKCYLRAWLDHGENGLKLLLDVFSIMYSQNISYAYFWVNSTNVNVKKIHELLGAIPDGLKDYTFIKK